MSSNDSLARLAVIIESRKRVNGGNPDASYVTRLLERGPDAFLKKIGEEATEVVIAALSETRERLISEIADLVFHVSVLMADEGIEWAEVEGELERRASR